LKVSFRLNGEKVETEVEPKNTLLDVIRRLGYKGTKKGCEGEGCGACTVIVNGRNVYSCMYPAPRINGKEVITIEGIGNDKLSEVQEELIQNWAFQCGYCTPGFIIAVTSLIDELKRHKHKIEDYGSLDAFIKSELSSHICRCTGYVQILEATRNLIRKYYDKNKK
jgi:carbon-monoxide dehydrogenase small subunit